MERYESYKDSGIYFLPNLPSDWEIRKAKYLFKEENRPVRPEDEIVTCFRDGQVTLRKNRRTEGFTNSLKEIGYQGVRKGDLVIHNMDAFAGAIGISDSDGKGTPVYSCCTPKNKKLNQYYYCYLLRYLARNGFILSLAKGIRERSTDFRFNDFKELYLPVPKREEQDAIVKYLDAATSKIDAAIVQQQKMIDLLNERKQIIINNAITKGLNPNVKMKPSGVDWIGDIPEHWKVIKTSYIFDHIGSGTTPKSGQEDYYSEDGINFLQTGDLTDGYINDTTKKITEKALKDTNLKTYPKGSLVIAMYGATIGKLGILNINTTVNQACCVLTENNKMITKFAFYSLMCAKNDLILKSRGGGQPNISQDTIRNEKLIVPPIKEQETIVNYIDKVCIPIQTSINVANKIISLLQERKQIIINDVVTGKVKVI